MKQLKKTLLTLVALLAVTTGAWAQEETLLTTITPTAKEQASYSTANVATVSFSYTAYGSSAYLANWGWWGYGWIATVTAAEGYTITKCIFYDDANRTATDSEAPFVVETTEEDKTPRINGTPIDGGNMWSKGIKKIEVYGYVTPAASSGPEVAWDKDKNSGSFTMPGGNVTLEPDYYPQATAAEGAVTAADADARATTDDPLVKVDATKLTGAKKLMYFVSNSGTTAPAYDAEGWTDQLPTAEGFTQQGIVYVWYYPVGTDEGVDGATATYSDGDICLESITAHIAAAPTYAVTFAEGTEESDKWKAEPNAGVKKGQTVTVTYTGSKKVIGVKAEKKAATKTLAEATLEDIGKIAGADGNIYDSKADAEAANTTAVAMIAYVGTASDCAHGLAIALADESDKKNYGAAGTACSGKAAVTGGTWRLPSIKDWQYMLIGCGASESYKDNPGAMGYSGLASKLTTAQGNALVQGVSYWSSTGNSADYSWRMYINGSNVNFTLDYKGNDLQVRACFAF